MGSRRVHMAARGRLPLRVVREGGRFFPPAAAAPERTLIVDGVKHGEMGLDDALALDASKVMFSAQW